MVHLWITRNSKCRSNNAVVEKLGQKACLRTIN